MAHMVIGLILFGFVLIQVSAALARPSHKSNLRYSRHSHHPKPCFFNHTLAGLPGSYPQGCPATRLSCHGFHCHGLCDAECQQPGLEADHLLRGCHDRALLH